MKEDEGEEEKVAVIRSLCKRQLEHFKAYRWRGALSLDIHTGHIAPYFRGLPPIGFFLGRKAEICPLFAPYYDQN